MSLLRELNRRNVVRIAILYLVSAWILLQVADVLSSLLSLPGWTGSLVVTLLALGFVPALIFAWVYELTPEGLRREKEVDRSVSVTHETGRKINVMIVVLLVIAIGSVWVDRFVPQQAADEQAPPGERVDETMVSDQSTIAVLPFVNMSSDEENEYFSDGLSEELLNLLTRIPQLRVAARTSSFSFKGSGASIAEIAKALNVAHVLEGSVRKSGDTIRITVQLIEAASGFHVWSETYDREFGDVLDIQDEIALSIVDTLKITLLGEAPTSEKTSSEVYALFLKGLHASESQTRDSLSQAQSVLEQAVALDPDYSPAWEKLAAVMANQAQTRTVSYEVGFGRARGAAERALAINSNSFEAYSTLGFIALHEIRLPEAAEHIGRAKKIAPDHPTVLNVAAIMAQTLGYADVAERLYKQALVIDPLSLRIHFNLSVVYIDSLQPDKALATLELARSMNPDFAWENYFLGRAWLLKGDADKALAAFGNEPNLLARLHGGAMALHALGRRDESDEALARIESEIYPDSNVAGAAAYDTAVTYGYRGDVDQAFEWLDRAYEADSQRLSEARTDELLRSLHSDRRWPEFLARLGLSDEQVAAFDL